jgi:hypothetical protein
VRVTVTVRVRNRVRDRVRVRVRIRVRVEVRVGVTEDDLVGLGRVDRRRAHPVRPLGDVIGLHGDVAEVRGRCARGVVPSSLLHALGEARVGGRLVDERAPEDGHPP